MKSFSSFKKLVGVSMLLLSILINPCYSEQAQVASDRQSTEAGVQGDASVKEKSDVETGALSSDEPLYAGTSTWFLLSIALLGSIAVQRRKDSLE